MEKLKHDDDSDAGTALISDTDEDDRSASAEGAQNSETYEEERVDLNNNKKSNDNERTENERSKAVCLCQVPRGLLCFGAISLYLFLWVVNATLLQGIASGSLSDNFEAFNKPFFLTYLDHNFHMISFIPVCYYVKCYRNYSMTYYLKDVWARRGGLKRSILVCVLILYILTFQNVSYIMGLECVNVPTANAVYQLQTGFTIIISVLVFGDFFTDGQAVGLIVSLVGVVLIVVPPMLSQNDTEEPDEIDPRIESCDNESMSSMLYGVIATAISAVLWGVFQVGWRWQFEIRHNEASSQNMTKIEGVIDTMTTLSILGFTNLFVGWPFVLIFHLTGVEKFEFPVPSQWGLIVLNGFIEYLFDFSCTLAIYITSPIMTAITAPLVIPLGLLSDYLIYQSGDEDQFIWWYLGGAVLVLVGTYLVEAKPKFFKFKDKNSEIERLLETKAVGSPANVC